MRECHLNYAHGPMKIKTTTVEIDYRGEKICCEKTVYACTKCDFEVQLQWMKEKMEALLEQAYTAKHTA